MPDDKLSLEEMLTQAAGGTPTPAEASEEEKNPDELEGDEVPEPAVKKEPAEGAASEQDPEPEPEPEPESTKSKSKSNPVKELRDKYTSEKTQRELIEGVITKYTNGDYNFKIRDFMVNGKVDYAALAEAMDVADTEAKAKDRGISPEIQFEIDRIERERIELEKERLQIDMDRALTNMQLDLGLKQADINNFFKDAMTLQKNPYQWLNQGGSLHELYNLVYHDRILKDAIDQAVASAREAWEAESSRTSKTPTPNPAGPKQPRGSSGSGVSLEELLEEAMKK
jgi:hypothetical protein